MQWEFLVSLDLSLNCQVVESLKISTVKVGHGDIILMGRLKCIFLFSSLRDPYHNETIPLIYRVNQRTEGPPS